MSTLTELFERKVVSDLVQKVAPESQVALSALPTAVAEVDPDDPREQIQVGVLMANGRLAPRNFANRAEAEAWAFPDEQVVEWNMICGCDR